MDGIPKAPWANAIKSKRDPTRHLPQTIAHRGYKASWPENTMGAFKGAVDVGAHAIETDLRLTAEGVVVLSHDPSLKRCFGVDKKISGCEWEYLKTLKTVREPRQGMPRLRDLLEWLNQPGMEDIWILLDIKIDDDAEELIRAVAETFEDVDGVRPWDQRIVLGCWNATFIQTARHILPSYPIVHISWYLPYARHFLLIPNLGYNIFQRALVGPLGSRFLRETQKADRQLFVWTVNEERWMEWCLRKNLPERRGSLSLEWKPLLDENGNEDEDSKIRGPRLIDGVITDDPKLFLEVCEKWEDEQDGTRVRREAGVIRSVKNGLRAAMQLLIYQVFGPALYFHRRWVIGKLDKLTESKARDGW